MGVTASREAASQPRADARRNIERILEAAEACLARNPNASMSDIAAEAGLGRVTIYGHFASRQVIVEAVVHRVLAAACPRPPYERPTQVAWRIRFATSSSPLRTAAPPDPTCQQIG
jgi:AcrR family transcriptional regulator